jgi:hypothetical protein
MAGTGRRCEGAITVRYETIKRLRLASTPSQSLFILHKLFHLYLTRTRHILHPESAHCVAHGLGIPKRVLGLKIQPDMVSRVGGAKRANGSEIRPSLEK